MHKRRQRTRHHRSANAALPLPADDAPLNTGTPSIAAVVPLQTTAASLNADDQHNHPVPPPALDISFLISYVVFCGIVAWALYAYPRAEWHNFRGFVTPLSHLRQTTGVITHAFTSQFNDRRLVGRFDKAYQDTTYYQYHITYTYTIERSAYHADAVTFADPWSVDPSVTQAYMTKYPVGRIVTVFYDPTDPTFAVLEPHVTNFHLFAYIVLSSGALWVLSIPTRRIIQRLRWRLRSTRPT